MIESQFSSAQTSTEEYAETESGPPLVLLLVLRKFPICCCWLAIFGERIVGQSSAQRRGGRYGNGTHSCNRSRGKRVPCTIRAGRAIPPRPLLCRYSWRVFWNARCQGRAIG